MVLSTSHVNMGSINIHRGVSEVQQMPLCWNGKQSGTKTESVTINGNGLKIQPANPNHRIRKVPISSTRSDSCELKNILVEQSKLLCRTDIQRLPILTVDETLHHQLLTYSPSVTSHDGLIFARQQQGLSHIVAYVCRFERLLYMFEVSNFIL